MIGVEHGVRIAVLTIACCISSAAVAADPIRIGLSEPLSGPQASLGEQDRWGAELAVSDINAGGGVLGRLVELVIRDSRCNPAEAVKAASNLIDEEKVTAIIGCMCSSASLATMPIAERGKTPFIVPISTAQSITDKSGVGGNEWTFKTSPTDLGLTYALIDYLSHKRQVKTMVVLAEDTDYGRGGLAAMQEAGKPVGINVVSADFFQQGNQDYTAVLTKYRSVKPDMIALFAAGGDQQNFFRQYVASGTRIPVTGKVNMGELQPSYVANGALNGTSGVFPYDPRVATEANRQFVARYKAARKSDPYYQGFYTYEAVRILAEAIQRAGSTDNEAIRKALKATSFRSSLDATLTFDDHNQMHNVAVVTEVNNGKVEIVAMPKAEKRNPAK